MKATGIKKRISENGSVHIPKEIRKAMNISENDIFEIYTNANDEIIFKKSSPTDGRGALKGISCTDTNCVYNDGNTHCTAHKMILSSDGECATFRDKNTTK